MARGFGSDNNSGIHPLILKAIAKANLGHTPAYGEDPFTRKAETAFKRAFGPESAVFFVFNGTGANVLALKALTEPHHSILCSELAHLAVDECGAPERFTGCKVIPVRVGIEGKLTPELLAPYLSVKGNVHHSQPRVISITQSTEVGTLYQPEELRALSRFAKKQGLFLHMDGARLSNAAASLGISLREATKGVDVLSFGGTKNGLLGGEAVVFLNRQAAQYAPFIRKQAMQLGSKMRFTSAQFLAFLEKDLWRKNAGHANRMAKLLEKKIRGIPGVRISRPVEANGVFPILPRSAIQTLRKKAFFYVWDAAKNEIRLMTSFDTTREDIDRLAKQIQFSMKG